MGILKGKLVKKDDKKLLSQLEIQEYPWLNFRERDIVLPDNPRGSVILTKFHDPKEIREKVKEPSSFQQKLEKKTSPVFPVDLTLDFERGVMESIKQKRRRMMGEEEAMALELAEIDATPGSQFRSSYHFKKDAPDENAREAMDTPEQNTPSVQKKNAEENVELKKNYEEREPIVNDKPFEEEKYRFSAEAKPVMPSDSVRKESEEKEIQQDNSAKELLGHIESKQINWEEEEKELEERREKARQEGYLDGFKNGEERALKVQETKYEAVFQNITHVIDQLEKLKNTLYAESREVFIEILKLCTEQVLREQLKFSDTALYSLFDEVLKTLSQKSTLKIDLNSQDLPRLKAHLEALGLQERVTLNEDNEKQSGDFSIESERGVSLVNLKKSVENFVEKLKEELFEDSQRQEKAAG